VEGYTTASWRYWKNVINGDFPPPPVPGEEYVECNAIRWT
jgi:hypothetical protein